MVRPAGCLFKLSAVVFGAALLALPCAMLAQRGAGGGHVGGGTAGGGGLGSVGKPTSVDEKDDLKDFHAALAMHATTQQIIEYAAMMKTTEAARAELKAFSEQLGKQNSAAELASRTAAVEQAIERARTENKKFVDGFSDRQKSSLKEITRRLIKADADLAQQAKVLDLEAGNTRAVGQNAVGQTIATSAQTLERALMNFQTQQTDLGEEMSIQAGKHGEDSAFNLPPAKNLVTFANHPVAITTSGVISRGAAQGTQNSFKLELTADLSDLQQNITAVLHSQLDKAERCGERIAIQSATLTPLDPATLALVQLHIERWTCRGREVNEIVEGGGTIEVRLTPSVGADGTLRLTPEIGRVDAQGLIGELLRSGSLGETLRDKITESLLAAIRQAGDLNATLPPAARGNATLHRAQFEGTGLGKLLVVLDGEIRVSTEQATSLLSELKASELKEPSAPATVQLTGPR